MFVTKKSLPRRTFLKGAGAALIAMPFMDAMIPALSAQTRRPFRFGAGGRLGNGRQWFAWIDLRDALDALEWLVDHHELSGAFNVTSPEPVTNAAFTKAVGDVLRRPTFATVPAFVLRLALGDMADELLLASARAVPSNLLESGFRFNHAELRTVLEDTLSPGQ